MFKANSMINVNHFRKVVIVIGNGFDLDLNLKTSYKNFMTSKTFKDYRKDSHLLPIDSYSRLNLFDFLKERFDGNDKRWIDIEIENLKWMGGWMCIARKLSKVCLYPS